MSLHQPSISAEVAYAGRLALFAKYENRAFRLNADVEPTHGNRRVSLRDSILAHLTDEDQTTEQLAHKAAATYESTRKTCKNLGREGLLREGISIPRPGGGAQLQTWRQV